MSREQVPQQTIYDAAAYAFAGDRRPESATFGSGPTVRLAADFAKVAFVFDQTEAEAIARQSDIPAAAATEQACLLYLVRLMEGALDGEA
ncbi:MAG: hypothetical protein ABI602_00855 [Candidatus Saccharibacteria bacterium]